MSKDKQSSKSIFQISRTTISSEADIIDFFSRWTNSFSSSLVNLKSAHVKHLAKFSFFFLMEKLFTSLEQRLECLRIHSALAILVLSINHRRRIFIWLLSIDKYLRRLISDSVDIDSYLGNSLTTILIKMCSLSFS